MKLSKIHFSLNNPFLKMNSLAYGRYQLEMLPMNRSNAEKGRLPMEQLLGF